MYFDEGWMSKNESLVALGIRTWSLGGLRKINEECGLGRFEVGRAVILHCYGFLKIDQFVGVKKVEGGIKCLR